MIEKVKEKRSKLKIAEEEFTKRVVTLNNLEESLILREEELLKKEKAFEFAAEGNKALIIKKEKVVIATLPKAIPLHELNALARRQPKKGKRQPKKGRR